MPKRERPGWDDYFMAIAKVVAQRSTCISRVNGAVIVEDNEILGTGYNGWPPKTRNCIEKFWLPDNPCERLREGFKTGDGYREDFCKARHAEINALSSAKGKGKRLYGVLSGATIYLYTESMKEDGHHYKYGLCGNCTKEAYLAGITKAVIESVVGDDVKRWEFDRPGLQNNLYEMKISLGI